MTRRDDPARFAALAAATALMVALLAFLAYALRLGTAVNFFSETLLVGFKCGLAFHLASTQLPKLFGFAGSHGDFWENMAHFPRSLGKTNPASLALGAAALVVLLLGKTLLKHRPVALLVLIVSIALAGTSRRCFRSLSRASCSRPSRLQRSAACSLRGMGIGLTRPRNSWRSAAALITLVVALFLTDLLRNLPQPALAAIVLAAITGLVDVHKLRQIWRFSREEFGIAAAAFLGVLGAGLLDGVLIGVAISILLLIHRAARPRVTEIGRVPGTSYFSDLARHPENQRVPDVLVFRSEGALLYFNVDHVRDWLTAL